MPGIDDRATPLFKSVMVYMMLLADQINTFGARQPNAGFDEFDVRPEKSGGSDVELGCHDGPVRIVDPNRRCPLMVAQEVGPSTQGSTVAILYSVLAHHEVRVRERDVSGPAHTLASRAPDRREAFLHGFRGV
jgi:hypothetical protein